MINVLFSFCLFKGTGIGFGLGKEFADDCDEVFTRGDDGRDKGEDTFSGEVGVPKLDGRDNFDSEETNEVLMDLSDFSSESEVQRTVGNEILRESLFDVSSISGESAILF